ncbi:protein-L-isoaspartate(D-aspartate) O-methyltransferase [Caballeronia sp. LZ016]|uniref:protein-L-isoaspartate(D-aspartate) O-methyltransferase n=1 Tax=Caballeronia sp. LZ016 TaxID=3038554 RepID=UPI00285AD9E9|nr:protein-L-isoaspartate(D-aspartate) O-methyltransferase [Caballeronia sp. LZ016]MDR5738234.1 protein-L-isoaspartate(D-aspartate) O-methyltransferase [Caballeronia sp. LZ016]
MSDERAKRFPLALADLVREPRKPAGRADASRVKPAVASSGKPGALRSAASAPKSGAAASTFSAKSSTGLAKPVPGTTRSPAQAPHPRTSALRTAQRGGERDALNGAANAASKKGAPNVALASTQTLTSERVRERMVERLRANGITDSRVLNAMSVVPRHMFVDPGLAAQAYEDAALPIGHHQTISKPSVVARMIELVAAGRTLDKVLEIGTGCGYQAAVLSQVAKEVYSIERVRPLSERAKLNLRPLRVPNIRLHYGDGRLGLPAAAPFDAIVIACAGLDVPQALLDQLAVGGKLVAPVGSQAAQSQVLTLVTRISATQWRESQLDRVFFVPLKSGVI